MFLYKRDIGLYIGSKNLEIAKHQGSTLFYNSNVSSIYVFLNAWEVLIGFSLLFHDFQNVVNATAACREVKSSHKFARLLEVSNRVLTTIGCLKYVEVFSGLFYKSINAVCSVI